MGNLLEYSGIITKLRAMEARLLTDEQFEEIAALTSVTELVSYLNAHSSYQDVLQDMNEAMLHRGNIEKVLILSLYHDYTKIYRFCGPKQRKFLKLYLKRYEVDLINYCLRIVINHYQEPGRIRHMYKRCSPDSHQIPAPHSVPEKTMDKPVHGSSPLPDSGEKSFLCTSRLLRHA